MYLTIVSLIDINNGRTIIWKVNNKRYMDKVLIEDKLYQLVDQFNERKLNQ